MTSSSLRPSSALVLVRDSADGPQILLMRRAERGDQNSGAWVFPGGLLDAADAALGPVCAGLDEAACNARLGLPEGGLAWYAAAVRECFEEAGLLLAVDAEGRPVTGAALQAAWRTRLHGRELGLDTLCREQGFRLALGDLKLFAHIVTPPGLPKRFDTRFFLAAAPEAQEATHDGIEMTAHAWLTAAQAVQGEREVRVVGPVRRLLAQLSRFTSAQEMLDWAAGLGEVPCIRPQLARDAAGRLGPLFPDHPGWAEARRVDPRGEGIARAQVTPGEALRLSERVIRLTAANPGVMTGPGTNSYLVGALKTNEWAVIDPGPADAGHVQALQAAAPGPIRWILVTHTHLDHSPGAALLARATGARVLGRRTPHAQWQDEAFNPVRELHDGERLALDAGSTLHVVHTPGHASNHLCYLLEEEATLFTGDHVMQGSTVVINPPDGDMAAYLASLQRLRDEFPELQWLAPGHGFLIAQPPRVWELLLRHRQQREAKLLAALTDEALSLDELLPHVYDDVPPTKHRAAERSLLAQLLKLRAEGRVREVEGAWRLAQANA
ncbi:MBL fold metallo-hydrolase [Azohydromonas caseinilytica]|uniref:MBL fold metallo-hydrolase n=1 Tax=Azohydromonas caseinilytica TaxID=2728836 RepID=A0A848FFA4_9BURK|nr:MBL fold metallo-hydrolase [Azohydromonas caseinilytica]NML17962.1 MBL fold metallo-hydrolase [Azohydromonas caseinilytica]